MVFTDAWDDGGNLIGQFSPDMPVVGIGQGAAREYCRWLGKRMGRPVRLPTAGQWEKAARGVDGRQYPWGNSFLPDRAMTSENRDAKERYGLFAPVGSFPGDRSVYGALDMGGNAREWTGSRFQDGSGFYQIKGSSGSVTRRFAACAFSSDAPVIPTDVGFRYVMPLTVD
jgi:formylglycine-generating enzyme required for sulfatase activity